MSEKRDRLKREVVSDLRDLIRCAHGFIDDIDLMRDDELAKAHKAILGLNPGGLLTLPRELLEIKLAVSTREYEKARGVAAKARRKADACLGTAHDAPPRRRFFASASR